jgi:hypothetical protein
MILAPRFVAEKGDHLAIPGHFDIKDATGQ